MNILLAGGTCSLSTHLIEKLMKEGHHVFLLTGSRYKNRWYPKADERYDFPYDAANIPEIVASVSPDLTIALGAFDPEFSWKDEEKTAQRYVACMTSLMLACAAYHRGGFAYLSNEEAFSLQHTEKVTENDHGDAHGAKGFALAEVEESVLRMRSQRSMDAVVVRIGNLYHIPHDAMDCYSIVEKMCLSAFQNKTIPYDPSQCYSFIYESDAIYFLSSILFSRNLPQGRWQVAADEVIDGAQLAELIRQRAQGFGIEARPVKQEEAHEYPVMFDNDQYRKYFGINRFDQLKDGIDNVIREMVNNPKIFLNEEERKPTLRQRLQRSSRWFVEAAVPFIENAIVFFLVFTLNNRTAGSSFFSRIDFYLIYVLLFGMIFGQQQATLSAALATAGYILGQVMQNRSSFEVMIDYNTYVWIAQLFIVGLGVGYMRDKMKQSRLEADENYAYIDTQLSDMKDISDTDIRIKQSLEEQVVNQSRSIGTIYDITKSLQQDSYDEVLFHAAEIMMKIMNTKDVAIYTVSDNDEGYARLFSASSPRAMSLGRSIRISDYEYMVAGFREKRIFINRALDPRLPMMANAVFEDNSMRLMFFLWGIPWERMTFSEADIFAVVCLLIHDSTVNALKYMNAIEETQYFEQTHILRPEPLARKIEVFTQAEEKSLFQFQVYKIPMSREQMLKDAPLLEKQCYKTDAIGYDGSNVCIVLSNSDEKGLEIVRRRFMKAGFGAEQSDEAGV